MLLTGTRLCVELGNGLDKQNSSRTTAIATTTAKNLECLESWHVVQPHPCANQFSPTPHTGRDLGHPAEPTPDEASLFWPSSNTSACVSCAPFITPPRVPLTSTTSTRRARPTTSLSLTHSALNCFLHPHSPPSSPSPTPTPSHTLSLPPPNPPKCLPASPTSTRTTSTI